MTHYKKHLVTLAIGVIIAMLTLISCSQLSSDIKDTDNPTHRYQKVTLNAVADTCVPIEKYAFPAFGVRTMSFRLKDCLGIEDMFMIVWPREDNSKLAKAVSNVLVITYVNSENKDVDPTMPLLSEKFIKYTALDDSSRYAAIYELIRHDPLEE